MRKVARTVWLGALLIASAFSSSSFGATCGLPPTTGARDLQRVLSLRAVEVIRLASNPSRSDLAGLAKLVKPAATFSAGGGDVRVPLPAGIEGARALARDMSADTYRYLGYDYMDAPADSCSKQKVSVEFVDSEKRLVTKVEFTFEAGLITDAAGWSLSFEAGSLKPVPRR